MAGSIGEALRLLSRIGDLNVIDMGYNTDKETQHHIRHRFKETIICPLCCLESNIEFMLNKGDRYLIFADNKKGKVVNCEEIHICELKEDVKELYDVDIWTFINRWYKSCKGALQSMYFLKIKVKEVGNE